MSNLFQEAISSDNGDHAAKVIQKGSSIRNPNPVVCFPKSWPDDRAQRASITGEWLQTEARFLAE
jgi:hypothetical protein